jgi:hypothetical protein
MSIPLVFWLLEKDREAIITEAPFCMSFFGGGTDMPEFLMNW